MNTNAKITDWVGTFDDLGKLDESQQEALLSFLEDHQIDMENPLDVIEVSEFIAELLTKI